MAVKYLTDCRARMQKNTWRTKASYYDRFLDWLKDDPEMSTITAGQINEYLLYIQQKEGSTNANRHLKDLKSLWNWAGRIRDVPGNPIAKTYKLPHRRKEQYVPMQSHIQQILMVANQRERAFLQCYLQTAARKSEIFAWKWGEDVDFQSRQVRLSTQKTRDGSVEYVWLPMNQTLFDALTWWYKNRDHRDSEYVWTIPEGTYEGHPYTFRHKFLKGLCKRAGVPYFAFHSLRRYAASLLAARGVPMKTIQRILRHKSLATTERYVKRLDEDLRGAVEKLGNG